LGRHKSWGCRRLALIERLGPEARDELRVGFLSPSAARQLVRLPQGNQAEVLQLMQREALSASELAGVVDLLLECPGRSRQEYILPGKTSGSALAGEGSGVLRARSPAEPSRKPGLETSRSLARPAGPHGGVADPPWPHRTHARSPECWGSTARR